MNAGSGILPNKGALDRLYERWNRREFVHPDPLEVLYGYPDMRDREIVALIASALAFGRVKQILGSIWYALERIGKPSEFVLLDAREMNQRLTGFFHRWATPSDLSNLMADAGNAVGRYGSLENCFLAGYSASDETVLPALSRFARELAGERGYSKLLPAPERGSACKRLHLFLRWMVRQDDVDPGGWSGVPPSKLVVPLDTHMHRISRALGFTERNQADAKTAEEITAAFRLISPEDPVKYDFSLTRLGIRTDADYAAFAAEYGVRADAELAGANQAERLA